MQKGLKVVVIGGGSSYTPELMDGFIQNYKEFPVTSITLVDVESGAEKVKIIYQLAKRMMEKANIPIQLTYSFNRKEALKKADFVCTQIRVGGLAARVHDEKIPLRYGKIGQETTGAGGFAKALRTIPVILSICRDMEEVCPDAVLINFTNPAGMITEAVAKYTKIKAIGLCNIPIGIKMQIADVQKIDVAHIDMEMVGINHLNWTRHIYSNGKDLTADTIDKIASSGGLLVNNIPEMDMGYDFVTSMQMLPCSYLSYYYLQDGMVKEQLQSLEKEGTRAEVVMETEKDLFSLYERESVKEKPKELEARGGAYYSEAAVQLMMSMYNDTKDLQIVNVQNNGILPFLADDAVIETKCVITSNGPQAVQLQSAVNPVIIGLLQVVKNYETLAVEAIVDQNYKQALHALTIHPLVASVTIARKILNDYLRQNAAYHTMKA